MNELTMTEILINLWSAYIAGKACAKHAKSDSEYKTILNCIFKEMEKQLPIFEDELAKAGIGIRFKED